MIQIATVETDKANRLMKALRNHLSKKVTAKYEGDKGYFDFGDGTCEIAAYANSLEFQAMAETSDGLDHVKRAVEKHLQRFTSEDNLKILWREPSRE
jgi:caffeoyl-CoA O-methyltransferase